MIRQDIDVEGYWHIAVFYDVETPGVNQGFSFTRMEERDSIVVIGRASSRE